MPVERVPRHQLDRHSDTGVHNGVMALAEPLPSYTVQQLIDELFERGELPFLALVDDDDAAVLQEQLRLAQGISEPCRA